MNLTKLPNDVALTGLPIPVNFSGLDYKTSAGNVADITIDFGTGSIDGDTIVFVTNENNLEFMVKSTPTGDFDLPAGAFITQSDFLVFIENIINNYSLDKYYRYEIFPNVPVYHLRLVSFVENPEWQIKNVFVDGSGGVVVSPNIQSLPPTFSPGYKLKLDLYQQKDYVFVPKNNNNLIDQLVAVSDDDNTSSIDLQNAVNSLADLKGHPLVYGGSEVIAACPNSILVYHFNSFEEYGNPVLPRIPIKSPSAADDSYYFAVKCGMSNSMVSQDEFVQFYVEADKVKFLTQLPSAVMRVPKNMPNRLYFYNKDAGTNYLLKGRILQDDGSYVDWSFAVDSAGYTSNTVYKVLAGFDELMLGDSVGVGRSALRYSVWVHDGTNDVDLTEEFWFKIEPRHVEESNFFYFQNSFGGYDGVWLTGELIEGVDFESTPFRTNKNIVRNLQRSKMTIYSVRTGQKYKDELVAIADLLNSADVYWLSFGRIADKKLVSVSFANADRDDLVSSIDYTKDIELTFTDGVIE